MKTLANCTPREFLKQTNRIRACAEEWLTATKVLEIRQRMPKVDIKKPESREELAATLEAQRIAFANQVRENVFAMLEAMLDTNADKTLELLCLVCFIEPEDADKHTMSEFMANIAELISDAGVLSFFGSLVRLGLMNTESVAVQ